MVQANAPFEVRSSYGARNLKNPGAIIIHYYFNYFYSNFRSVCFRSLHSRVRTQLNFKNEHIIIRCCLESSANQNEQERKERNLLGFDVFLSRLFFDFCYLTIYEQQEHAFLLLGVKLRLFNMGDE